MFTLTPGEESEGNAFGSVCLSVWARHSKTVAPIGLYYELLSLWLGPPLL